MTCWINGLFYDDGEGEIPVSDRGFLLGDGIFDTLLVLDGQAQYLKKHCDRLRQNAEIMKLPVPEPFNDIEDIISELITKSGHNVGRSSLRTTLTRGSGPRGLDIPETCEPTLVFRLQPAPSIEPSANMKMCIARNTRRNEHSMLSQVKSLNYADPIIAIDEARAKKCDNAILLNSKEDVACAANGNIYALINGKWITPPIDDGVLGGTVRQILIDEGIVEETRISKDDLLAAEAAAFSNSLIGVVPIITIDDAEFDTFKAFETFGGCKWECEDYRKKAA